MKKLSFFIIVLAVLLLLIILYKTNAVFYSANAVGGALKFNPNQLPPWIKVCEYNCNSLAVPVVKVCPSSNLDCNPSSISIIEYSLNKKPLVTFDEFLRVLYNQSGTGYFADSYSIVLVDSKNVLELANSGPASYRIRSNGASKIKILFDKYKINGNPVYVNLFFSGAEIGPGSKTKISYESKTDNSASGIIQFFYPINIEFKPKKIFDRVKEITKKIDTITRKPHVKYNITIMPPTLSHLLGGDGNFYLGGGKIAVNYDYNFNITCDNMCAVLKYVDAEISHEYTHAIQQERGPQNPSYPKLPLSSCFFEGMADALTIHLGYNHKNKLIEATTYADGCPKSLIEINNAPHNFGRCLFGHLMLENVFSNQFFKKLFNPQKKYEFDDPCDVSIEKTCNLYVELFNWSSGTDTRGIMREKIKGNC